MIKINKRQDNIFLIKGVFAEDDKKSEAIIAKDLAVTEDINAKVAYVYLGKKAAFKYKTMKKVAAAISSYARDAQVDVQTFVNDEVKNECVVYAITEAYILKTASLYSAKENKKNEHKDIDLINVTEEASKAFDEIKILTEARNYTRNLQITPPNILNSETYAAQIVDDFKSVSNVKVTVLNKKQITDKKMGLLLSVNKGSAYEPRVVVLEYTSDSSKEKTGIVGKGITFDAGGYNIKTGRFMSGMKYDMSGSAIVAGLIKALALTKAKANVVGILVLTDNMISSVASTPDSVWYAMNGKSVEINNTDAEGRLALADGLTFAARDYKASRLIDVATLTGAVISALGNTYTGVWSTTEKGWEDIAKAAKNADEQIWRLPLHEDYEQFIKGSKVADLFNTDLSGNAGSSSAAMFLTNFVEGKEYIHLDVAGTADVKDAPMAPMIKTLYELVK